MSEVMPPKICDLGLTEAFLEPPFPIAAFALIRTCANIRRVTPGTCKRTSSQPSRAIVRQGEGNPHRQTARDRGCRTNRPAAYSGRKLRRRANYSQLCKRRPRFCRSYSARGWTNFLPPIRTTPAMGFFTDGFFINHPPNHTDTVAYAASTQRCCASQLLRKSERLDTSDGRHRLISPLEL